MTRRMFMDPLGRLASRGARLLARLREPTIAALFLLSTRALDLELTGLVLWAGAWVHALARG